MTVHIITGDIDAGKTTRMRMLYREVQKGDGFVAEKILNRSHWLTGYAITRLSTGESRPLAYKTGFIPEDWDEIFAIGPFRFSGSAFRWGVSIVDNVLKTRRGPAFIDEIGPLELQRYGWAGVLERVLDAGTDLYFTVRRQCLENVLGIFDIPEYRLIEV